jgi:phosphotriesterase-related protein
MPPISRRIFLKSLPPLALSMSHLSATGIPQEKKEIVMTVRGPIESGAMGQTLIHEHILVDFIGAKYSTQDRWNRDSVTEKVLPFLEELKQKGCQTFIDCTPNYLGRDAVLLKDLSDLSGLNIITNTGYYGGSDNKFLPDHAFTETAQALAARWITEWKKGIAPTSVKPGFIKISVNPETLSDISKKLIHAAALTHLQSGLTIASHTGPAVPAFEQIAILKKAGVHPGAFIWVHAQTETEKDNYVKAAREGAWVSLDGLNDDNVDQYTGLLTFMKAEKCLDHTLISHDAGWFDPAKSGGGEFRKFTTLFDKLIPALKQNSFTESEVAQLVKTNPKNAFTISIRRAKK